MESKWETYAFHHKDCFLHHMLHGVLSMGQSSQEKDITVSREQSDLGVNKTLRRYPSYLALDYAVWLDSSHWACKSLFLRLIFLREMQSN